MKYFVGMLAIVGLVAGATVGAYRAWDKATHTREDNGGVLAGAPSPATLPPEAPTPAEGQVIVSGTLSTAHVEGLDLGTLPTPFTVSTATRGEGGATITPVLVNGKSTSIEWTAGQPLPLSGDGGGLTLGPVALDVADGVTLLLDGVHGVVPGTYTIATSVAVGSQPKDSVTFEATDTTTIEFRGTATTPVSAIPLSAVDPTTGASGTGTVTLEGALTVAHPDRSTTTAAAITLDSGTYTIALTPAPGGGFNVQATLQGPTH
ncbi:MAG: hypothetical protein QOD92_3181 [Acidimicrobiaceae bacterium]|jgi:hypothetical protein